MLVQWTNTVVVHTNGTVIAKERESVLVAKHIMQADKDMHTVNQLEQD